MNEGRKRKQGLKRQNYFFRSHNDNKVLSAFQEEPTNRDKDLLFVKNILYMLRTLAAKMKDDQDHDPEKAKGLRKLQTMATGLIEEIGSTGSFEKSKMLELMKALEAFYNDDDGDVNDRAPFCQVGEDCFSDVDHKLIAMEIKRLALSVTRYMKDRMMEEERPDSGQRSPLERALVTYDLLISDHQ